MTTAKFKILLVESDSVSSESIRNILSSQLGFSDIVAAVEGGEALNRVIEHTIDDGMASLFSGKKAPKRCAINLVLLSWKINGMSAFDFLKEVRKQFDKKALPVIIMTQGDNKEDIIKAVGAGANNFIITPINSETLNRKMAEVLGRPVSADAKTPQAEQAKKSPTAGVSWYEKVEPKGKEKKVKEEPVRLIGAFYEKSKDSHQPPVTSHQSNVIDISQKIDGHYHEEVNVIGGGTNCYWARDVEGKDVVSLEYVSAKGRPSGIHVKVVPKSEFVSKYKLCTEDNCQILKRLKG
jgi:DNA-binding response OmpR family regulator